MVQCGLPDAAASLAKRSADAVSSDNQHGQQRSPDEGAARDRDARPLRFLWQMDAEGRFSLGADEFTHLIGVSAAAALGRPWSEIAHVFGLDPEGHVAKAIATRDAWSGITVNWPADGGGRLPVELTGLPMFDRMGRFAGYRGFGICRDRDSRTQLTASGPTETVGDSPAPRTSLADNAAADGATQPLDARASDPETRADPPGMEMPENVVPFRPPGDPRYAALTLVENNAFNELARQLAARLESENLVAAAAPPPSAPSGRLVEPPPTPQNSEAADQRPGWLAPPEQPARGEARRDRALFDLLPVGVLIYRLDRLLYANPAFLGAIGYRSLHDLEEAGGLDALYVEAGVSPASSTSDTGTPVRISAAPSSPDQPPPSATDARLYTIEWDGDPALALIFSGPRSDSANAAPAIAPVPETSAPSPVGQVNAEELGAILDSLPDAIVMFDAEGNVNCCNRSAEALFGYDGV
jgi:PAS domain-containing protein